MTAPTKTHLTYSEAAKWLEAKGVSISIKLIRAYVAKGWLKVCDMGHRSKFVTIQSLEKLIERRTR